MELIVPGEKAKLRFPVLDRADAAKDVACLLYTSDVYKRQYWEFVDCTEECRREYENDGEVMVRLVNGTWLPMLADAGIEV